MKIIDKIYRYCIKQAMKSWDRSKVLKYIPQFGEVGRGLLTAAGSPDFLDFRVTKQAHWVREALE